VTAALEPAASSTNAPSWTDASDYDPIVLMCCFEGLKPLDTGSESEYCRASSSGNRIFTKKKKKSQEHTFVVDN